MQLSTSSNADASAFHADLFQFRIGLLGLRLLHSPFDLFLRLVLLEFGIDFASFGYLTSVQGIG